MTLTSRLVVALAFAALIPTAVVVTVPLLQAGRRAEAETASRVAQAGRQAAVLLDEERISLFGAADRAAADLRANREGLSALLRGPEGEAAAVAQRLAERFAIDRLRITGAGGGTLAIAGVTDGTTLSETRTVDAGPETLTVTFERELVANWALRTTGVYARNFDLRRLAEPLRPRSAYSIAITNPHPGNDGIAGTADDPSGRTITYYEYPASMNGVAFAGTMIVPAEGTQTFKTIEVAGIRRVSKGWQASASISATKAHVPFVDEQADNPNSEINTLNDTWETTSKISGGYTLPFDVIMSATYERRSGTPQAPSAQFSGGQTITQIVLNIEPIGTISLPPTNLWNMRFAKRIRLRTGQSLEARFDFFNIFNANFESYLFLLNCTGGKGRIAELWSGGAV